VASSPGTNVWQAHELSTWIFHGALDEVVPIEDAEVMYYELNWDDVDVQLTVFDSLGHDIGGEVYSNPAFYEWLSGAAPTYGSQSPNLRHKSMSTEIQKAMDDDYLLYLPVGYEAGSQDWPLLIYLHGSGSAIWDLDAIRDGGPPQLFEEGMDSDFILLCPQLHADVHWDVDRINALTQEIMTSYRVDASKVYLTGLSRGGFGAWEFGVSYPNMFAAIVPISARDVAGVERLANNTVWIFHGDQDTGVPWQGSQVAFNRLNNVGADVHFTLYEGVGHWAWEPAYATEGLWIWMLSQQNESAALSNPESNQPDGFQLHQNFPNPFNSNTSINFTIPTDSKVSLHIFDLQGNLVVNLGAWEKISGSFHVTWNGINETGEMVPTGLYLTRLQVGSSSSTVKMLLLK